MPMEREMKQEVIHMNLENTLSGIGGIVWQNHPGSRQSAALLRAVTSLQKYTPDNTGNLRGEESILYFGRVSDWQAVVQQPD